MTHSLKGAAGNLMAEIVQDQAHRLEVKAQEESPEALGMANHLAEQLEELLAILAQYSNKIS